MKCKKLTEEKKSRRRNEKTISTVNHNDYGSSTGNHRVFPGKKSA
jgi:hypothetical protein